MLRLFGTLVAATMVAAVSAAGQIRPIETFAVDHLGNRFSPQLGEKFWVRTRYIVAGALRGAYQFAVSTPYQSLKTPNLTTGLGHPGEYYVTWGPLTAFKAEQLKVSAAFSVRPGDTAVRISPLSFSIAAPDQAVEFFSPKSLTGRVGADLSLANASAGSSVEWWIPMPATGSHQTVASLTRAPLDELVQPDGQSAAFEMLSAPESSSTRDVRFNVTASSVRVNVAALRVDRFSSLASLPAEAREWLTPETYIESTDPSVTKFVNGLLPRSRSRLSVYDAAEKLFKAVVSNTTYDRQLGKAPSAVQTLKTRKGDCGAMSSLFVAACRNAGIPARTLCGFTTGTDNWHVWAEFYVPSYGWVPVDPSYSDGIDPQGKHGLYFGTIPELNERVITSVGYNRVLGGKNVAMFQSPIVFVKGASVQQITPFCELGE